MLIDAATFLVSLASLAAVRREYRIARPPGRPATWPTLARELAEGVRYLAATRLLFTLLMFLLVLNLCLGADKLVIFLARTILHLGPALVGLVVTAGGVGGLLGAIATSALCRRLGPLPVVAGCAAASSVALILVGTATGLPVLLAANLLYTWAVIAASVTLRALRQALVPRPLLGRVTAAWRLGGQGVTLAGAVLAGAATALLAGDPRPVLAAAGLLTILCTAVAWLAALRQEDRAGVALAVLGRRPGPGHN
jgi:predicted MFS family arabinose efflux permease